MRRHRADQVALHPEQLPVEKHIAFPQSAERAAQAFLFDSFAEFVDQAHEALLGRDWPCFG
ncbi:hypothetical protein D3C75_1091640 [compost metagenome]